MKLAGGKRMKTGAWGTDASVLQTLADQGHELPARILDWRQLQKLKSTYADALVGEINPETGRVHTSFAHVHRLHRAAVVEPIRTCRTSRSAPRKAAASAAPSSPSRGMCWSSADYSQIELRLLAHVADIPALRRASSRGEDIHARTASRGVRRADGGHGPDDAAPRQGDQLRHHLRHQRLRPGAAAGHHAGRGARLYRCVFRPLSRHPRLHGADEGRGAHQRLRHHAVRAPLLGAGHRRQEPGEARLRRAAGDQRAAAGRRRRTSSSARWCGCRRRCARPG